MLTVQWNNLVLLPLEPFSYLLENKQSQSLAALLRRHFLRKPYIWDSDLNTKQAVRQASTNTELKILHAEPLN